MSHKITGKEPLQKPCNCNTQDVLPSKLDIAIAEYKEMARKAEEARDEFLQKARALEDIAKETNATANKNAILAKFDDITIDTSTLAKDATVAKEAQATLNKEAIIAAVNNAQPDLSTVAKQGADSTVTLTGVDGKVSALPTAAQIQSSLAKEVQVKDGNDTAISVGKEVRSELGTGSDTAAETGTLFAVVKWVKDKVKAIYNALTDSTNGLSAIKSAIPTVVSIQSGLATASSLSIVATDAAAAKTAAQSLTSLESDINAGKTAIAQAVSSKGIPTSASDTMLQMATNITQISQSPISINGGEMYAKQLFGSLETPNYWNLYDVLAQLLSDGRLVNYGGILLAEYYRGYDSFALSGAGAGGAYVVSDKEENGQFKMYTEDTTHTWATEFDGKGNRWVAYCFADAGHGFDITDTNTSPRRIYIGRNVGTITSLVDGRLAEIIVPDGSILTDFNTSTRTQNWGQNVIIRNISEHNSGILLYSPTKTESVYIQAGLISKSTIYFGQNCTCKNVIIDANSITKPVFDGTGGYVNSGIVNLIIKAPSISSAFEVQGKAVKGNELKNITIIADSCSFDLNVHPDYPPSGVIVNIGFIDSANKLEVSIFAGSYVKDVYLLHNWCKNLNISTMIGLSELGIYEHILQRLKQDEPDCGDGVTIALGATNLAKLTSQESIDLLDILTNTYGYTFA